MAALLCVVVTGCAGRSGLESDAAHSAEQECLTLFNELDRRVTEKGVADASFARIPGVPHLRVDPYSASFADETATLKVFLQLIATLSANDQFSREVELKNLGLRQAEQQALVRALRDCGIELNGWATRGIDQRQTLINLIQPRDAYSQLSRSLGLFAVAKPFLERGVSKFHAGVLEQFSTPLSMRPQAGEMRLWRLKPDARQSVDLPNLRDRPRDALGRIPLNSSELMKLARAHAPGLWIDTADSYDLPGQPVHTDRGPKIDPDRPVVYFRSDMTRFGERSFLQISYWVWFSERPAEGWIDPEAGRLDGLIWRVTLDDDGRPLFYDTIHACGCYHYGFSASSLQARSRPIEHSILMPQAEVPAGPVALRLASGTHALERVVAFSDVMEDKQHDYELRPYEELLTLPHGQATRSLFGADGMVRGSERPERLWLWLSGVRNAGAMRQWGHHVTSFTDQAYFDDPFLLEKIFVPPRTHHGTLAGSLRKSSSR